MSTIDMSVFFPWGLIYSLVCALFTRNIVHAALKDKYGWPVTLAALAGARIGVFFLLAEVFRYSLFSAALCYTLWHAAVFVILIFLTEGSVKRKLFTTLISFAALPLSYLLLSLVLRYYLGRLMGDEALVSADIEYILSQVNVSSTPMFIFPLCVFIDSLSFPAAAAIRYCGRRADGSPAGRYLLMYVLPLGSIFFSQLYFTISQAGGALNTNGAALLLIFVTVGLNYVDLFVAEHYEKIERANAAARDELETAELDIEKRRLADEKNANTVRLNSEMADVIGRACEKLRSGETQEASVILQSKEDELVSVSGVRLCANATVNAVLTAKSAEYSAQGVTMTVTVDERAPILIGELDICRLLCNICDNCANAVSGKRGSGSFLFDIKVDPERVTLTSRNAISDAGSRKFGQNGAVEHGYGQRIVRDIAKKYDGFFTSSKKNGEYLTVTVLVNKRTAM